MPIYQFINDETGEVFEVVQGMNDKHELIIDGKPMRRLYTVPNASIDSKVTNERQFIEKTGNMKGTIGDIQDFSRELSEKRGGDSDPIKRKYYKDYAKKRKGKTHPDILAKQKKERLATIEKKTGIKVSI